MNNSVCSQKFAKIIYKTALTLQKNCDELKLNLVAVVLTAKIVIVKFSFVPIAEVTIMDFIDFNLRSLS